MIVIGDSPLVPREARKPRDIAAGTYSVAASSAARATPAGNRQLVKAARWLTRKAPRTHPSERRRASRREHRCRCGARAGDLEDQFEADNLAGPRDSMGRAARRWQLRRC